MQISVKSNINEVLKGMNDIAKQQAPYAASLAINDICDEIKGGWYKETVGKLDRPTPFTRNAFGVQYSRKTNLVGVVFTKDIQEKYLIFSEEGGSRTPKSVANVIPRGVRVNEFGNMPNKAVSRMLNDRSRYFSGIPKGWEGATPGVWRRMGTLGKSRGRGALRLEVAYVGTAHYGKRTDYQGVADRLVARRFEKNFTARLEKAIATAK